MFYKQRVLADLKPKRKQTVYRSFHVHTAVTHATLHLQLAQIGALFVSQNAIFVKK